MGKGKICQQDKEQPTILFTRKCCYIKVLQYLEFIKKFGNFKENNPAKNFRISSRTRLRQLQNNNDYIDEVVQKVAFQIIY